MIHQPTEFLRLFALDRRERETVAAAERFRRNGASRRVPASVPPRTVTSPAAVHTLRPAGSHTDCRHAA